MDTVLSFCIGLGLSAACGFRVFVPLLVTSIAAHCGQVTLAHGFQWIGSDPALIAFSVATVLEICGYYIPWVDHFLDTLATPAAVVAGTLVTASFITDMSPFLRWALAVIAGGGVASMVQASTVLARGASTLTTGGLGNPLFATAELAGSVVTSVLAVVAPVLVVLAVLIGFVFLGRRVLRTRTPTPGAAAGT